MQISLGNQKQILHAKKVILTIILKLTSRERDVLQELVLRVFRG